MERSKKLATRGFKPIISNGGGVNCGQMTGGHLGIGTTLGGGGGGVERMHLESSAQGGNDSLIGPPPISMRNSLISLQPGGGGGTNELLRFKGGKANPFGFQDFRSALSHTGIP